MEGAGKSRAELLEELVAAHKRLAELEKAESRYRALFEGIADGIIIHDVDGYILDANQVSCERLGHSRETLRTKHLRDILPRDRRRDIGAHVGRVLSGEVVRFETTYLASDGSHIPCEVIERSVEYQGHKAIQSIARDITRYKQAEAELGQRTAHLETLRDIGMELTAQLELNALLCSIASRGIELLGGTSGGLYIYRPDREVLERVVSIGPHGMPVGNVLHRGQGLSGKIWETGEPLIVSDYQQWHGRATTYDCNMPVAAVGVPIRWGEEFLGVLNVNAVTGSRPVFSEADADLLGLLATQASIAIRNARLYEQAQQEIAERQQAEHEALAARERLQHLLTAAPAVVYCCTPTRDNGITFISENVRTELGYNPSEFTSDSRFWVDRIHPDDRPGVLDALPRAFEQGHCVHEYRFRHKDGGWRWVHDESRLVCDPKGKPIEIVGYWIDITKRRWAEDVIVHAAEQWELTFAAVPDLIALVDTDYQVLRINKSMSERLGVTEEDAIGRTCYSLVHGTNEPPSFCPCAKVLAEGHAHNVEVRDERLGGDFLISMSPFCGAEGKLIGHVCIARDITERNRAVEALRESEQNERRFQQRLRALLEATYELSRAKTFDVLCRRAVELGRGRLAFDRLGIWFFDENDPDYILGSFGTDEEGNIRDERQWRHHFPEGAKLMRETHGVEVVREKGPLSDAGEGKVLPPGERVMAPISDGANVIGLIAADNLLRQQPITAQDTEILVLYASALGHLRSRQKGEEALAQERDLLHALMDNMPDHIFFKDRDSRFIRTNRAHAEILGLTDPQEAVQKTDFDLLPRELAQKFYEEEQQIMRSGKPVVAREWRMPCKGGKMRWLSEHKIPVKDETGRVVSLVGIARDITERKEVERVLQETEKNQRRFQERLRALIEVTHELSRIESFERLCRRAVELGRSRLGFDRLAVGFFDASDPDRVICSFRTDVDGRTRDAQHVRRNLYKRLKALRGSDGVEVIHWEGPLFEEGRELSRTGEKALAPVSDGTDVLGFLSIDNLLSRKPIMRRDRELLVLYASTLGHFCSRHRAEQELRESEERYRTLFDESFEAISVTQEGRFVEVNPAWLQMHGFRSKDEVTGMDVVNIISPDEQELLLDRRKMPTADGKRSHQLRDVRKDGTTLDVETHSHTISLKGKETILTTLRDITERKRVEEEKARLEEQLRQVERQRMEELQRLALIDPLTEVGNRRYGMEQLQSRLDDMRRYGSSFGVLLMDIDHFKKINDSYGHDIGDRMLKKIARALAGSIRSSDAVTRWGGEEFLAIIRIANKGQLHAVAEKLRAQVEATSLVVRSNAIHATISIGATIANPNDTVDTLIKRGDQLLYRSKTAGRDCVSTE